MRKIKATFLLALMLLSVAAELPAYPIDGYLFSGIRRLVRLQLIQQGEISEKPPLAGARKSIDDIQLNLYGRPWIDTLLTLPEPDVELQKALNKLFPNLDESYSITLMDITPDRPVRYAARKEDRGFQPGSVGKLAVISALFCELEDMFPEDFAKRQELLRTRLVKGGSWVIYDEHTVPFYDPETKKFFKRQVQEKDVFSLYEWADHTLSVSNNGAASVVWREAILMRVFREDYLNLSQDQADAYFKSTPRAELSDIAISVVNDPLRSLGIEADEWRLGQMFTRGATAIIPGKGGSIGSPEGLMKWMVALELGEIVDPESSLEIKRLMYMTDRRIRYAANVKLNEAAVYFKSGSLYKCDRSTMPDCGKYQGNVMNYMNSVAIVEHPDSTTYLVALMSNVLRRNSNIDHNTLSGRIDDLVRK